MARKNTKIKNQPDEVPNLVEIPIDEIVAEQNVVWEPGENALRYVVVRGGLRVSDKDYPKPDEPRAIAERDFWQKVVDRWPDGTKVEIVLYDKKKHRIW